MAAHTSGDTRTEEATRREFLRQVGNKTLAGGVAAAMLGQQASVAGAPPGQVGYRVLGKTGLHVSEIGFGGHSWAYAKVPDGSGGLRKVNLAEAMRMISIGLDLGVNLFDSCTPPEEHSVPGTVIKRLKKRDQILISAGFVTR